MKPLFLLLALAAPTGLLAQVQNPLSGISLIQSKGTASLSVPMQIVVMMTVMTVLPAIIMSVTPFLRITIVLHFLRQALGTQGTPSNQVLLGLSLFITMLIMQPVTTEMYHKGWEPIESGKVTWQQGFDDGSQPLKAFLVRFVREKDVKLFLEVSHTPAPQRPSDLGLTVLVPSYILSELKTGFQIGAILFLPFLVIDLVVASVTLSIGMVQLPPVMLSAPFKILLFVLVDGWNLVVGSLVRSFYPT
jgi:flagellar biosynthesis protein FliP